MNGLTIQAVSERRSKAPTGEFTDFMGEPFYKISNHDGMSAFFMTIASASDVWNYVWSNGGLTAGRINADHALFPYYTADKVSDGRTITGPAVAIRGKGEGGTWLWEPFAERGRDSWKLERNVYKNSNGSKLYFEERNLDLGLAYRYGWTSSDRFGLVRPVTVVNEAGRTTEIEILDGCRNILPACVSAALQNDNSVLLDAYKKTDIDPASSLAIFSVSSIVTDKAEPSEGLLANVGWFSCEGDVYLDPLALEAFRLGDPLPDTAVLKGLRPSLFVRRDLSLAPGAAETWYQVLDTDYDAARMVSLANRLADRKALTKEIIADVEEGNRLLDSYIAAADGIQDTADIATCVHHKANVMFNIMRGGLPADGDRINLDDFAAFCENRNRKHAPRAIRAAESLRRDDSVNPSYREVLAKVRATGDAQAVRLCLEYLPFTFSRRHGDPSRPWNRFSIELKDSRGNRKLNYQGNWRDIFQNWEALALSWPVFLEGMIAKFLNASTADGFNPYRVTRDGIDWEVVEPDNPWSNIGYWGDHQVIYLAKLLELRNRFERKELLEGLSSARFSSGNVPYRLKGHAEIVANPRSTIEFDFDAHRRIEREEAEYGTDAKLLRGADGEVTLVSMTAKFLSIICAKMASYVPGGGIWLNTQRPEWNDANNALAGYGLSMVTLSYLRRFLVFLTDLYRSAPADAFDVPSETAAFFRGLAETYAGADPASLNEPRSRRAFVDSCGTLFETARASLYRNGYAAETVNLSRDEIVAGFTAFLAHAEATIAANRRSDGLYHAYNTLAIAGDGGMSVGTLNEMLEGQVAVLSSGQLDSAEALSLLRAMKKSALWREDQYSYILYPNRELPHFLAKNAVSEAEARRIPLLAAMLDAKDASIVVKDENGRCHFHSGFRNAAHMDPVFARLAARGGAEAALAAGSRDAVYALYEKTFDHRSFTGRSGTFYAYEGLGSIYWHMVAKLMLAVQEYALAESDPAVRKELAEAYYDIRKGIGFNKTPTEYGAFPTDPYSHTPAGQGAKQPGMTGQVKEEIITRWGELGLRVRDGALEIWPSLLKRSEFGASGRLSFTWCGVPFSYRLANPGEEPSVSMYGPAKPGKPAEPVTRAGGSLTAGESRSIFLHDGSISRIEAVVAPCGL